MIALLDTNIFTTPLKCPCCLSNLEVTHQDRYETLTEHVEDRTPSLKNGYQCPNSKCAAYEYNGVWIEDGDFWIKEPPAGVSYEEAEKQIERHSLTGRVHAVNSWQDGYERYREEQKKMTVTLDLHWFIFQFVPGYRKVDEINEWKSTGKWRRTIMRRVEQGRYVHFMTFWDIYFSELKEYRNNYQEALNMNKEAVATIWRMANNLNIWGKPEKGFLRKISRYAICWIFYRNRTQIIMSIKNTNNEF